MKILHTVEFYAPTVGGAQEVVRQVSEQLARRGHDITVATTRLQQRAAPVINGVRIEEFSISGNAVSGFKGETDAYLRFLCDGDFDLMMNYAAQQWATDLVYGVLDRLPYTKVLAPCGFSSLFAPTYESYYRALPAALRKYDHLILHSSCGRDNEFAQRNGISRCSVIPNGASLEEFRDPDSSFRSRYGIPPDQPLLITVGSHTGTKGHSVVMEGFRRARIGPATLIIIGNLLDGDSCLQKCRLQARLTGLTSFGRKRVLLLDPPRPDVVAAYHAADLFLFASNIECSPIVLFEAAASQTPFLSTACGNAMEIAAWTSGGQILPTDRKAPGLVRTSAGSVAKAIEDLFSDKPRLAAMAEAGFNSWKRRFTWETVSRQYEELYETLRREGR